MIEEIEELIIPATPDSRPDTPETIAEFESRISHLPEEYKNLLLKYGPFAFNGSAELSGGGINDLCLTVCRGIGSQYTIAEVYEEMEDVFGDHWIPFADDAYGSVYGFDRNDETIWFFDIEAGFTPTKIFNSMRAFLDAIIVEPD
ncbi:hypothetical protein HMPREF1531_00967 [Propionibacterium sp. oral taxon 192 str. F0372]|uniref:SMI1/KNR4 family protein n=1 Tax=Propionibacterium sp. oral taxon 192 TaxID=671222 RepID=UPI00035479D0|nr:SMI1/KNR4 family protein [Propionibacterium sp. oral taxon 192]EPH05538.1 hypothetical protein HMPREF1531_00967 [Propionibacterium sp. oral taxon 192 str. F0372]